MDDAHMDTPEGKVLVGNGYYTPDEIAKLSKPSAFDKDKNYYLFPAEGTNDLAIYDIYDVFPNPDQAMDKMGVNGYLSYLLGTSKTINVSGGYQSSDNISSTYGEMPTPYSGRVSTSGYVDVKADINKLSLQANYYGGTTDFMTGNEGFKLDIAQYNFIGEYAFMYKNLGIRPGISYQHIAYDDSKYLSQPGRGFLNQEQIISIGSANLRLDYTLFEKLRLVAALRAEQYNHPNDLYGSYQFVASYKFNENNILRMVYSRANQSAFIVNTYSDYTWNIVNRDIPRVVHYGSNDNYDLKTMDMIEIGYRTRPVKSVLLDVEGFYQVTNNLGALRNNFV